MERCYLDIFRSFSVDALALVLFSQSQCGAPRVEHERRFDGNSHERYNPAIRDYCGPPAKYHVKQPKGKNGLR